MAATGKRRPLWLLLLGLLVLLDRTAAQDAEGEGKEKAKKVKSLHNLQQNH